MGLSQLDILYDFEPKKIDYIDRKFKITSKKTIIHYAPKSGMTYLIYSHLLNYNSKDYIYIDFNDLRVDKIQLKENLNRYIYENSIKLLILENFDFSFEIPKCEEIIITTCEHHNIDGYKHMDFYPLDFEEFIAFERSHTKIENIFNSYANSGTFPKIAHLAETDKIYYLQNIAQMITKDEKQLYILKLMSTLQAQCVSLYNIFNTVKKNIKISKDIFYSHIEDLKRRKVILFLDKYNHPKATKKIYLMDFTLKNALSFEKDFIKRFENIIFLEIYKRGKNVYYTDEIDFYLPDENIAILGIPFLPPTLLKNKIIKRRKAFKKLGIKKVYIISLGNEDRFYDKNIEYEIMPFWNWALGEIEN